MKGPFYTFLSARNRKETVIAELQQHPEWFSEGVTLALSPTDPMAWRAVWVLREAFPAQADLWVPYIDQAIAVLPRLESGHQREWLKALEGLPLNEEQESLQYDLCLEFWSNPNNPPSLRHTAFLGLARFIEKYPELQPELDQVTVPEYLETLSPGVRRGVEKRIMMSKKGLK